MRTSKRCRFDRLSQMPDWNAGTPHLRVRRSGGRAVPGQTLERGKGRNQVAASIKEQNCDRQINRIYRDKMAPYLSSFLERIFPLDLLGLVNLKSQISDLGSEI